MIDAVGSLDPGWPLYFAWAQRAARDGDYKYLKILDNTFLFNVVEDPMERANLKERRPGRPTILLRLRGANDSTMSLRKPFKFETYRKIRGRMPVRLR